MQYVYLVVYSLILLASRGEKDFAFRIALAQAIVSVTSDPVWQLTLIRTAREESGFRRNVARCETHKPNMRTEDHGKSFGTYQVQPMSFEDSKLVCGTLEEQTEVALRYMHRSAEVCSKNIGADSLNLYTSGRCDWGHDASVKRWGGNVEKEFSLVPMGE